jgi:hypothetical protein
LQYTRERKKHQVQIGFNSIIDQIIANIAGIITVKTANIDDNTSATTPALR